MMKFNNGYWLIKDGYKVSYAKYPYKINVEEDSVGIVLTPERIYHRGQTLTGPIIKLTVSSPRENAIRVTASHYETEDREPHFEIFSDSTSPEITENDKEIVLTSGKTRAVIDKNEYGIDFYYGNRFLTSSRGRALAYIKEDERHSEARKNCAETEFFARHYDPRTSYMREMLTLSVGEYIYGLGERFTPFVRNGQSVEMWNSDGGTCSEQSYKNVPFFVSSRGYGVFVNSTDAVEFEIGSEVVSKSGFSLPGEKLDYFVIGGETPTDAISNYALLTGAPALPPAWSFGLWLSTSFTTNYDENTVMSFIDGMAERNIPLEVFHFDCFWMEAMKWCNFKWDPEMFPDPCGMMKRLHERGLHVCVWINPYISQLSELFSEGKEKGYFLKNKYGDVYEVDMWQPGMAIVDFTNPEAAAWYRSKLSYLADMGVDAFKTDFGERIPDDAVYCNGNTGVSMHNYYSYIYNKVVFDLLRDKRGEGEAAVFARSGTAGSQALPVHWGGDCSANYDSMAEVIRGCLSLAASGFGFVSHDIGGFEDTAPPDIYKRWLAFGMLSTHSRLHGSSSYRVPWNFDEESCDVADFFVRLKGELMPYLWREALRSHEKGTPVIRSLGIEFPKDRSCLPIDTEYMLGSELLVAPILNPDSMAEFYLPASEACGADYWIDIITGEKFESGRWHTKKCSYFEIPALVRRGSVIIAGMFDSSFDYDYTKNITANAYGFEIGEEKTVTLRGRHCENYEIKVKRTEDGIRAVRCDGQEIPAVLIN